MENSNKQIALLDYCLPDYFSGYNLPVVSIGVYKSITCEEMAKEIEQEINYTFDYLELSEEDEQLYKKYCEELKAKGSELFIEQDELNEDDECAYAYFSVINPVFKNGITFLNS